MPFKSPRGEREERKVAHIAKWERKSWTPGPLYLVGKFRRWSERGELLQNLFGASRSLELELNSRAGKRRIESRIAPRFDKGAAVTREQLEAGFAFTYFFTSSSFLLDWRWCWSGLLWYDELSWRRRIRSKLLPTKPKRDDRTTKTMTLKLWTREFSGNCYKVRLLLSFLGIKAEEIQVDTKNNEQKSQEYRRLNPRMQIPALEDGEIFVDSASILVYLAGKYSKDHQWYSNDLMEQVKMVEWLAFTASWIEPGLAKARVLVSLGRADLSQDPIVKAKLKEAQDKAVGSLEILENEFKAGKKWLVADRVTIAGKWCKSSPPRFFYWLLWLVGLIPKHPLWHLFLPGSSQQTWLCFRTLLWHRWETFPSILIQTSILGFREWKRYRTSFPCLDKTILCTSVDELPSDHQEGALFTIDNRFSRMLCWSIMQQQAIIYVNYYFRTNVFSIWEHQCLQKSSEKW